jgi:hypothetical protein
MSSHLKKSKKFPIKSIGFIKDVGQSSVEIRIAGKLNPKKGAK